jgi:RNA polymerase sigma-70 factor (ECF subfamily)
MVEPSQPVTEASAEYVGLVMRSQRRLYAFIYALLRRPADAEDVLQETNLVLWKKAAEFAPGTDFTAWACRIAQFQVMAFRKRHQRTREYFDDALLAQLAEDATIQMEGVDDRQHALLECVKTLKPAARDLVARRYEPGGSVNVMAERSGRSPKAVSEALRRVREALLRCIERRLSLERG